MNLSTDFYIMSPLLFSISQKESSFHQKIEINSTNVFNIDKKLAAEKYKFSCAITWIHYILKYIQIENLI